MNITQFSGSQDGAEMCWATEDQVIFALFRHEQAYSFYVCDRTPRAEVFRLLSNSVVGRIRNLILWIHLD